MIAILGSISTAGVGFLCCHHLKPPGDSTVEEIPNQKRSAGLNCRSFSDMYSREIWGSEPSSDLMCESIGKSPLVSVDTGS